MMVDMDGTTARLARQSSAAGRQDRAAPALGQRQSDLTSPGLTPSDLTPIARVASSDIHGGGRGAQPFDAEARASLIALLAKLEAMEQLG